MDTHSLIHDYVSARRDLAEAHGETWTQGREIEAIHAAFRHLEAGRKARRKALDAEVQGLDPDDVPADDPPDLHPSLPEAAFRP